MQPGKVQDGSTGHFFFYAPCSQTSLGNSYRYLPKAFYYIAGNNVNRGSDEGD